mmetsp:Transcript_48289/g.138685  ORF Transcript_48289/g.138685 Transcript_48289/m.138685 type:complete len:221 (-) Transcript_48289:344-1006(-)
MAQTPQPLRQLLRSAPGPEALGSCAAANRPVGGKQTSAAGSISAAARRGGNDDSQRRQRQTVPGNRAGGSGAGSDRVAQWWTGAGEQLDVVVQHADLATAGAALAVEAEDLLLKMFGLELQVIDHPPMMSHFLAQLVRQAPNIATDRQLVRVDDISGLAIGVRRQVVVPLAWPATAALRGREALPHEGHLLAVTSYALERALDDLGEPENPLAALCTRCR